MLDLSQCGLDDVSVAEISAGLRESKSLKVTVLLC